MSSKAQSDTAIYNKINSIEFKDYIDKPAESFFKAVGYNYLKYIPAGRKPGYIGYIIFRYSDSLSVDIAVKQLGQKEPLGSNYKLNINEFKGKKIDWICLRYGGRCIKGCEMKNCDD